MMGKVESLSSFLYLLVHYKLSNHALRVREVYIDNAEYEEYLLKFYYSGKSRSVTNPMYGNLMFRGALGTDIVIKTHPENQ